MGRNVLICYLCIEHSFHYILIIYYKFLSNYRREVKWCCSVLYWVVFLWKYTVYKRRVSNVGSYTVCPWLFYSLLSIDNRSFVTYNIRLKIWINNLLFIHFDSLLWTLPTLPALYGSYLTMFIRHHFVWYNTLFFLFLCFFHFVTHYYHLELLLHYKVILLDEFRLFIFFCTICSAFKLFYLIYLWTDVFCPL